MTNCWRHFTALSKKNAIVWYRLPVCAFLEIAIPALLMVGMCILRHCIPSLQVDQALMETRMAPVYPGVSYQYGYWSNNTSGDGIYDDKMKPLVVYSNYNRDIRANETPSDYSLGDDQWGPQFFTPTHCTKTFDYQTGNKQDAPIIALIGQGTNITDQIGQYFVSLRKTTKRGFKGIFIPKYNFKNFTNNAEFEQYIESPDYKSNSTNLGICVGIEQIPNPDQPSNYTYKLHYPDKPFGRSTKHYEQGVPLQTNKVTTPYDSQPDLLSAFRYQHNGFSVLQSVIANLILIEKSQDANAFISMMIQPMATETTVLDPIFSQALALLMPLCLLLGFIPPVYNLVFKIVREKESRTKETMRIMGMTDLPYWCSWFFFYTCINTVVVTICWAILQINVIQYSNPLYLWLFFWLYGQAVFGQIIFLQSMFTGSKYAGIVSTVIYFAGVLLDTLVKGEETYRSSKLIASLMPQVALMEGSVVFAQYEGSGIGLDSDNASRIYYGYSFNTALWMLLLDFFVFTGLGLYMDKVIPSSFGQRLNPCFLCMPSFYRCCRRQRVRNQTADDNEHHAECDDEFERCQMEPQNYEGPPATCKRAEQNGDYLKVDNLQKTFSGGFRAVRGVNFKMFDSQIFALLGHNGAGKTTVISMLSGLIEKSQGGAKCYDVDLFEEMDEVREFMGLCPQHDVLFDLLTPREHLDIFYDFKGGDPATKEREIDALINDSGLQIDQNKAACTLSGGNKRKTSVCIALCGGSRLVMLDEPTSGMDLGARRNLWDMLKAYKKDRIIILTTHYMDEADVLGDRIGIMVQGQVKCIGSPLFLKNRFGVGYRITFVKQRRKVHPGLEKYLQSYFQGVQKAGEVQMEVSYIIPKEEASNFGGFFENLDQRLDDFDIQSYGVSMSNLEDVFLKINKEYAPDLFGDLKGFDASQNVSMMSTEGKETKNDALANSIGHSTQEASGISNNLLGSGAEKRNTMTAEEEEEEAIENLIRGSSCVRSASANSGKRLIMYKRDWCGLICQVVIPLTLVLFGLWLTNGPSKLHQSPPRPLSTGYFDKQRILMNQNPVSMTGDGNDITGDQIFAMLPNSTDAFEVTYKNDLNYTEFYDEVYKARQDGDTYPYRYGSYQIFKANKKENLYQVVNYLNMTSQESTAFFPQFMYNAILRVATDDPTLEFNVINAPFPIYQLFKDAETATRAFDFTLMVAIALALIPCVMVQFVLQEREMQLKHQQLLSGMSLAGYWGSNLFFDIIMAYIPIGLIILLMFVFGKFYDGVWILFLLYPPAVVPFTYVSSFIFGSDITAQICTLFIHFLFGAVGSSLVYTLQQTPSMMNTADHLRWWFTIVPSYCVTHGILWSASGTIIRKTRLDADTGGDDAIPIPRQLPEPLWAWYNLKGDAVILIAHAIFWSFILFLIEMEFDRLFLWCARLSIRSCNGRARQGPQLIKDDDVIAEEARVAIQRTDWSDDEEREESFKGKDLSQSNGLDKDPKKLEVIRVNNFKKIYEPSYQEPVVAVQQASFALDYGECFALLGVNGAGKSTTFKSLTREIAPTTGEITVQGFDVQKQFSDARKLIGYCPQYDAIFPVLTVEETIKFYALIKGIRTHKIHEVVEKAIRELNLKDHRHKMAGTLSGGNKRKLSVAMAIIGNPPIILLDEPSAGMDPEARRFMWQVVEKISQRDKKSAVILTTHSMEEAEALSTKLGIMVRGGVFRCMGSTQHIKNKFGVGYEVEIKVKKTSYEQLIEMAQRLGLEDSLQEKVDLNSSVQKVAQHFESLIIDQIKVGGLGQDLVLEAEYDEGQIRVTNLLEWLCAQEHGFNIINWICRNFAKVELLEQCGEFFKMRVPMEDKTIGWLFGQLENNKRSLGIQEYAVTQTTLEQIFQTFANQSIASDKAAYTFQLMGDKLRLINPDHKMTEEQERLSQRGLSFHENAPMTQAPDLGLRSEDPGSDDDDQPSDQLLLPANAK